MALNETLTAEEQAQLEQMRAADSAPEETIVAPELPTDAPQETEATETQPEGKPAQTMVPHAALHEERERRKTIERQLEEERKARRTLEERTNLLLQRFQPETTQAAAQPAAPALPDPAQDPFGHLSGRLQHQEAAIGALVQALNGQVQERNQFNAVQALQQRAVAAEREFKLNTADYDAAVAHLSAARTRELEAAGYTDPVERQRILSQEALGLAERAFQIGRNPAEVIYEIAKLRGYTPAAAQQNGQAAASQAETVPAEQRLARVQQGQTQTGRSLSQVRGVAPQLTAQRLLEMPAEEFMKMINTPEGKALLGA